MPTSVQPWAANHWDSARVEKRGPSMTTRVPELAGAQPCSRAVAMATERTDGQYGSANGTWHAPTS
jgi:hypothetical protein